MFFFTDLVPHPNNISHRDEFEKKFARFRGDLILIAYLGDLA